MVSFSNNNYTINDHDNCYWSFKNKIEKLNYLFLQPKFRNQNYFLV